MNEIPTHLDLFSGIGGFSLAAERCGFRTIGFSEIDPYASAVFRKHWPNVPNYGDIRKIVGGGMRVDLITGGFPCQPFSVAGERRGDSDERFLWPEIVRVMRELRPTFSLFENVSGLLTIDGGRTFNRILSDLVSVGYDCIWNLVPASAVGANHQRDRLWLIAYSNSARVRKQSESKSRSESQAVAERNCQNVANTRRGTKGNTISGGHDQGAQNQSSGCSEVLPDSESLQREAVQRNEQERILQTIPNSNGAGFQESEQSIPSASQQSATQLCSNQREWWESEPNVGRMAHGIPKRVDRLRCLGNSIVPQVAEIFLKEIRRLL